MTIIEEIKPDLFSIYSDNQTLLVDLEGLDKIRDFRTDAEVEGLFEQESKESCDEN